MNNPTIGKAHDEILLPRFFHGAHSDVCQEWRALTCGIHLGDNIGALFSAYDLRRVRKHENIVFYRAVNIQACSTDNVVCWRLYPIIDQLGDMCFRGLDSHANIGHTMLAAGLSFDWFVTSLIMLNPDYPTFLDDRDMISRYGLLLLRRFSSIADILLTLAPTAVWEPGFVSMKPVAFWLFPHLLALCCGWDHNNYIDLLHELSDSHLTNAHLLKRAFNDVSVRPTFLTIKEVANRQNILV